MYISIKHIIRIVKVSTILCFCFLFSIKTSLAQELNKSSYIHPLTSFNLKKSTFINAYDAIAYNLYLELDPRVNFIKGSNTISFKTKQASFSTLEINLSDSLTVDSIIYHTQQLSFTHLNASILISLPSALAADLIDSATIYYHGIPFSTGFGTFIKKDHDGSPIIWTLSEPYGSPDWWPCKHDLDDKADSLDVTIKTPQQYTAVSNGLLVDTALVDTSKIFHWKHRYPIAPYLVCAAVTNYTKYTEFAPLQTGDTVRIENYCYPEDYTAYKAGSAQVIPVLQLFSNKLGVYPFIKEKYGQIQFSWGGGMEHQTATFLNNATSFDLVAHELAHHWFGDKVTCGSWADIWLNEGFATYMASVAMENIRPDLLQDKMQRALENVQKNPEGTIYVDDTTSIARIFSGQLSYDKGSLVLHMLRFKLGDSLFFAALRSYLQDPLLAYKNTRTADLKRHLENISGQNLTKFFNQWVFGYGIPSYTIYWKAIGNDSLYIKLEQSTNPNGLDFFELPVEFRAKSGSKDVLITVNNTYSSQEFRVKTGFPVETLAFDPQQWLITMDNRLYQLSKDIDITTLSVYPNPANTNITLYTSKASHLNHIEIMDALGNVYISLDNPLKPNENTLTINLALLNAGIYFIHAQFASETSIKKLLIIK